MKPEKRHLLEDLLDEEQAARREAAFVAGGRILRRKRWRRVALRSFAVAAILGAAVFSIHRTPSPRALVIALVPAVPDQPKALTDEELLALFPNTPVALASLENGTKRLIFPRAGDEAKFVTKL
jgi:hypothetical protein